MSAPAIAGGTAGGLAGGEAAQRFAAAHRALVEDGSVQFGLVRPPAPTPTPHWLHVLGEWIGWALRSIARPIGWLLGWIGSLLPDAPYARIVLWSVIALLAAAVLWMAGERIRHGKWRWPTLRRRSAAATEPGGEEERLWEAAPVRAWLREADALAALGRFGEAAHLLLFRSVEDLARRRPGSVQPALTARELAAAPALPRQARDRFAAIAALVERSLFGGRPVDAEDWQAARADYAAFALPGAWRG